MIEAFVGIAKECWLVFKEAAPFVLFGFFAAGLLKVLIPEKAVVKHLGGNGFPFRILKHSSWCPTATVLLWSHPGCRWFTQTGGQQGGNCFFSCFRT